MTKPLLTATIVIDAEPDHRGILSDVHSTIALYREDGELIWRAGGPLGDEVEVLPRPATVAQAQADFRLTYPINSAWHPRARWL